MFLATGVFAMGDARYYSRVEFPDLNPVTGVAFTDAQIIAAFTPMEAISAAKLIAVQKSILYDPTAIPDADPTIEHRVKVLMRWDDNHVSAFEIPCKAKGTSLSETSVATAFDQKIFSKHGGQHGEVIKLDTPPERKARGK